MKHAAVIGYPVKHSRSPRLHGYWLEQYGIAGIYEALEVAPDHLRDMLLSLQEQGFCGVNITVPHKEAALACMDVVDATARRIGAVNTVVVQPDGSLLGRNTDAYGFIENLRAGVEHLTPFLQKAVVLGAGGAARAVCVALMDAGAENIMLSNRSHEKAKNLQRVLGGPIEVAAWDAREDMLEGATLLVNTTSLGMDSMPALELSLEQLPRHALVSDIVYRSSEEGGRNPAHDGAPPRMRRACAAFERTENSEFRVQSSVEGKRDKGEGIRAKSGDFASPERASSHSQEANAGSKQNNSPHPPPRGGGDKEREENAYTPLLLQAQARGNRTVDGLGMLLYQAQPAFEAFFGVMPDVTDALRMHVLGE